jgi:hypothetical protein
MVDLVHTKGERTMQIKTVDGDREVASKGVAGTALGLGIAGTVGLLNQWANGGCGGFGGGFFGGRNCAGIGAAAAVGMSDAISNHDTRVIGALESKFLTQYYLADFKSLGQDPVKFICMAVDRLHDVDDPHASEHAYYCAMRRLAEHK